MFYLYLLLALGVLVAATFAAPLKSKVWVAFAAVVAAAVAVAIPSIGVLAQGGEVVLATINSPFFGKEALSMDSLSALFSLVIGIAGIATLQIGRAHV